MNVLNDKSVPETSAEDDSRDRVGSVDAALRTAEPTSPELDVVLSGITDPRARVDRLNHLAWEGRLDDAQRSARLAAWAYEWSTTGDFEATPYGLGMASSLRTQAFLHNDVGNYTEALTASLRSLDLLGDTASVQPENGPIVIDVLGNISWTHRCYGDYAVAAEYGMRALGLSEERGDRLRQARLLNILGNIYADSNDLEAALQMGERALRLYRELGLQDGESVALNNLSLTYLELGHGEKALEACRQSLRIAEDGGFASVHLTALSTLGELYLGIKDFEQAEACLNLALALSRERGARYDEFLNLLNLGKVALGRQDAVRATAQFEEALEVILKMAPEQNADAGQLDKGQIVLDFALVADHDAAEVLQPGIGPLDLPAAFVATQRSSVLSEPAAVRSIGRDQFNASASKASIMSVTIVGSVADEAAGSSRDKTGCKSRFNEGDFSRRSSRYVNGDRKTSAVCDCHDFAAFSTPRLADRGSPFFAETKVASMKHSERSSLPRRLRSRAKVFRIFSNTPDLTHSWNRLWQVDLDGYRGEGKSSHCAPVRITHRMPFNTARSGQRGRPLPSARSGRFGIKGSTTAHCASVRSMAAAPLGTAQCTHF